MSSEIKKGLIGVISDETKVSEVMPEINSLTYRGYTVQDLCAKCKFEEVAYLLLHDNLPDKEQLEQFEKEVNAASKKLAEERGPCPDAAEYGINERFSNKTAIAPTASISIICGGASPGIEPIAANSYTHKTLSGSFNVRNKYLRKILQKYKQDTNEVWSSITTNQGSIDHLDFLSNDEKDVFKTAFEIDQRWLIDHSADRTPYISQAQSLNVFIPADIHKKQLHQIHYQAWKKGLKSLYYCRSKSIQRAEVVNDSFAKTKKQKEQEKQQTTDYEECLSCQ